MYESTHAYSMSSMFRGSLEGSRAVIANPPLSMVLNRSLTRIPLPDTEAANKNTSAYTEIFNIKITT